MGSAPENCFFFFYKTKTLHTHLKVYAKKYVILV